LNCYTCYLLDLTECLDIKNCEKMYYQEKTIDGILYWRFSPDGEWIMAKPPQQ